MKHLTFRVHPAGWPFISLACLLAFALFFCGKVAFALGLIAAIWTVCFFRDPQRTTPNRTGLVISPADGEVVAVETVVPDADLALGDAPHLRISIFLNIFDVHVNRSPVDGEIISTHYRAGKFLHAASDKASIDNERMALTLKMTGNHPYQGQLMSVVQIAGFIARRILCTAKQGDVMKAGQRYGIIRFGSRTDIYLPANVSVLVCVGQYMSGGETVLADLCTTEANRAGEAR